MENLYERYILLSYNEDGDNEEYEDYNIDEYKAVDEVYKIAKNSDIRILSNKKLTGILVDIETFEVIGGIWISDCDGEFSFDIVIINSHQNMGLSHILIKSAINEYEILKEIYDEIGKEFKMNVDVINPKLATILKDKYKFYVVKKIAENRVLMSKD